MKPQGVGEVQPRERWLSGYLLMKIIHWLLATILATLLTGPAHASKSAGTVIDDNTVNATVKADLIGNKKTKAHRINVETYKGIVQLSGFVATQAEKEEAAKVANAVEGVKEVRNSIAIGPETPFGQKLDDSVTTGKVKAALIDAKDVKSGDINVETRAGVVQLSGFVPSTAMRDKAATVAGRVEGVKQIDNVLQIRPD